MPKLVVYIGPDYWNNAIRHGDKIELIGRSWKSNGKFANQCRLANGKIETVLLEQCQPVS
jgi:hypothetical protein